MGTHHRFTLYIAVFILTGCGETSTGLNGACTHHSDCESGLCYSLCLPADGDLDSDGLSNQIEHQLGSDPTRSDTDKDGKSDSFECGHDTSSPLDSDGDGQPDLLESNGSDLDNDCLVDALDPNNTEPLDDPLQLATVVCPSQGVCATPEVLVSAECVDGVPSCSADGQPYEPNETQCDGLDNDCDGLTDEAMAWEGKILGQPCDGVGACGPGLVECTPDGGTTCSSNAHGSASESEPERCNALDDDCNGLVDDTLRLHGDPEGPVLGSSCPGYGNCPDGVTECGPAPTGEVICSTEEGGSHYSGTTELCNGLDDDCNGDTDESFTWTDGNQALPLNESCGLGACAGGSVVCRPDMLDVICSSSQQATEEICNNIDDDCDGQVDESDALDTQLSGCSLLGVCGEPGVTAALCVNGEWTCKHAEESSWEEGSETSCDGLDNDCDGLTDEPFLWKGVNGSVGNLMVGLPCGTGACDGGIVSCAEDGLDAYCTTTPSLQTPELCDNVDNDCDGETDENITWLGLPLGAPCDGIGGCGEGTVVCGPLSKQATCSTNDDGPDSQATDELCNSVDDDCDGETDESNDLVISTQTCSAPGVCLQGGGTPVACDNGIWICDLTPVAGFETDDETSCDGLDNDCDGLVDELLIKQPSDTWMTLSHGTPPPRREMIASYEPNSQSLVIVGGDATSNWSEGPKVLSDVWRYNLGDSTGWQPVPASGPGRAGASLVRNPMNGRLVLFGGRDEWGNPSQDTWELSPNGWTWSQFSTSGNVKPRFDHTAVVNPDNGWMWVFGGAPIGSGSAVAVLDLTSGEWTTALPDGPGWRSGMAAAFAPSDTAQAGRIVAFGGFTAGVTKGDTWIFEVDQLGWIPVKPETAPPPRSNHRMVREGNLIYLFGGSGTNGETLGDLWRFDLSNLTWKQLALAGGPTARYRHAFVQTGNGLLLVGGMGATHAHNDAWKLVTEPEPKWYQIGSTAEPPARFNAFVAPMSAGTYRLYGGQRTDVGPNESLGDVWTGTLHQETIWTLENADGPARMNAAVAYDQQGDRLFVHGGTSAPGGADPPNIHSDLWMFATEQWTSLSGAAEGAPPLKRHAALWDSFNQSIFIHGGLMDLNGTASPPEKLWRYNAETMQWTAITLIGSGPPATMDHVMIADTPGKRLLLVGGADNLGDIYSISITDWEWSLLGTSDAAKGSFPLVTYVEASNSLLFGTKDDGTTRFWWFNMESGTTMEWMIDDAPDSVIGASMIFEPLLGEALLFGGLDTQGSARNSLSVLPFSCVSTPMLP